MSEEVPVEIAEDFRRAVRLEYWTLFWIGSVALVMGLVMGSSQAMKTAWIEDMLSLVPAFVFLIAAHFEKKQPTDPFPYGFHRVHSLAFLISAVALSTVGAFLLYEAVITLVKQEHASIPPIRLWGEDVWMGWLMIGALIYSVVPPVILGRMKLPIARRLQDKVLHTDAMMQKADWMTGVAGIGGVLGLGFGLWWADALAAGFISFSILRDGISALRSSTAELIDGAPRQLESDRISEDAEALKAALAQRYPGSEVRMRESGRYICAQVCGVEPEHEIDLADLWPGKDERSWRLAQLSFVPPEKDENV